ncbi:hypothetical protein EVAR_43777_1 [Eumeta japonica]|uniref:Uncharacterized protein n=1 Tax=Eumeta variegata TaxID=151549 RepID=A0A4C1XL67_EUMVA|nr:hypothetical protein EVAR_43777_1 [Eumeta japonica]
MEEEYGDEEEWVAGTVTSSLYSVSVISHWFSRLDLNCFVRKRPERILRPHKSERRKEVLSLLCRPGGA